MSVDKVNPKRKAKRSAVAGSSRRKKSREKEYEVEAILSHEVVDGEVVYNVSWVGYPGEITELLEEDLKNCGEMLEAYKRRMEESGCTDFASEASSNITSYTDKPNVDESVRRNGTQSNTSKGSPSKQSISNTSKESPPKQLNTSNGSPSKQSISNASKESPPEQSNTSNGSPSKQSKHLKGSPSKVHRNGSGSKLSPHKETNGFSNDVVVLDEDAPLAYSLISTGKEKKRKDKNPGHESQPAKRVRKTKRREIAPDDELGYTNGCIVDEYKGFSVKYTEPVVMVSYKEPLPDGFESKQDEIVPIRVIKEKDPERLIDHLVDLLSAGRPH